MRALRSIPYLLLALPAFAQDEPPVPPPGLPPGAPVPGQPAVPAQPVPGPAVPAAPGAPVAPADAPGGNPIPGIPLGDNLIEEDIFEPRLSGNALAGLMRKYTGKRIIVTSAAAAAEFSFFQEASPEDPLTWEEAAILLRKTAQLESFVFVPDPAYPDLEILTLATGGINPKNLGIGTFTEGDILPEGDAVITYKMPLKYLKPEQAVQIFQQVIGQFGAYGSIAAVPSAGAVIITESTTLIRRLIEIKEQIDQEGGTLTSSFVTVQYADVTELSATLNELMTGQQQAQRTAGIQRTDGGAPVGGDGGQGGGANGAGGGASGEEIPVQIFPEPRTNRILVMGRPADVIFVEGLIRQFDIESDRRNLVRRKLRFLPVSDFLPIAGDALTRAFTASGESGSIVGGGGGGGGAAQQQFGGRGGRTGATTQQQQGRRGGTGTNQFGGGQPGGGGGGVGLGQGGGLSNPQTNSAPTSLLVGRTLLVADNITNSIVVQGPPSGVEIIENLLDSLDVQADQVMISTVFGQLSLGDTTSTGVNWLRSFRNFSGEEGGAAGGINTGGAPSTRLPDSMVSPIIDPITGLPNALGLGVYGRIGTSVGAYINMLQSNSNFTILSRPSIFTANNQLGTISSGRRIAIPTNSNQFTGGGVSTNIEYRDVVLRLEVIPLVNSPDEITLTISLVNDEVVGQSENIEGIGSVPIIGTRELLTTVTVPNNQTVVLGGLITTNDTETITGVPILSSIPGLRRLFSTTTTTEDRSELMIFIQPTIINGMQSLDAMQTDMDARYQVADDIHRMGAGPGVLPPPDAIVIPEKGSEAKPATVTTTTETVIPAPAPAPAPASAPKRTPIRPIHRR
jgi:general secretion pathway protein D